MKKQEDCLFLTLISLLVQRIAKAGAKMNQKASEIAERVSAKHSLIVNLFFVVR